MDQLDLVEQSLQSRILTLVFRKSGDNASLFQNAAVLLIGTAIGQGATVILSPITSRLYSPGDFAVAGLIASSVNVISVLSTAKYELALNLPAREEEARDLQRLGFGICAVTTTLLIAACVICLLFAPQLIPGGLGKWVLAIPLMSGAFGLFQLLSYWQNRQNAFPLIAKANMYRGLVAGSVMVGVGSLQNGPAGLVVAGLVGWLCGAAILQQGEKIGRFVVPRLFAVARKYSDFAKYNAPTTFIDNLTLALPILIFSTVYPANVVGQFIFAVSLISVPVNLFTGSISQSLLQRLGQLQQAQRTTWPTVYSLFKLLLLLSLFPTLLILTFEPEMISFAFGKRWQLAGEFSRALSFVFAVRFIVSPLSVALLINRRQRELAYWRIAHFVSTSLLLAVGTNYTQIDPMIWLFAGHELLSYTVYLILIMKKIR